jgi:hypothetical protein
MLEIERGSTRLQFLEISLGKRLWTWHQPDYVLTTDHGAIEVWRVTTKVSALNAPFILTEEIDAIPALP